MIEAASPHTMNTYGRLPIALSHGRGVRVWDVNGREYLDALAEPPRLFPAPGPARWHALLRQGLADGAAAAAGRLLAERRKPDTERVPGMEARFQQAIDAALDALEKDVPPFGDPLIGDIAAAAFIGYLDFRFPGTGWRATRLKLSAWFDVFNARPSMTDTAHPTAT